MVSWTYGKSKTRNRRKVKTCRFRNRISRCRVPLSSQNPMLQEILKDKPKMIVLMKKDLADPRETEKWIHHFEENQVKAIAVNVNDKSDISKVIQFGKELGQVKLNQLIKKGI